MANETQDRHDRPLYPDVGVMAFVPDTWEEDVWQVRHQVLTRLSEYFHVLWVNPAIGWRKAIHAAPIRPDFSTPLSERYPNFHIYRHSKLSAKLFRPRRMARQSLRRRVSAGVSQLKRHGCKKIIGYVWRPELAVNILDQYIDQYCYHIDDEYSFSTVDQPIDDRERQVIEGADHVFIHSPGMMEKKGSLNPNTTYAPNGVDFDLYASSFDKPDDLRGIEQDVVIYIGVLKSMLDWELLATLSNRLPDVAFVFVGPEGTLNASDRKTIQEMSQRENVHFVGAKDIDELPAYAAHASICIMPYRSNGYTKYIYPLKVNEYLAAGKPTIGTPIRTLQEFEAVVDLPANNDEWVNAIRRLLSTESEPSALNSRLEIARAHDWNVQVRSIAEKIEGLRRFD